MALPEEDVEVVKFINTKSVCKKKQKKEKEEEMFCFNRIFPGANVFDSFEEVDVSVDIDRQLMTEAEKASYSLHCARGVFRFCQKITHVEVFQSGEIRAAWVLLFYVVSKVVRG